ncbi:MarR family winged helix-turn-helix transcriptional regulator [Celerinatantimonas sp. MCCC 1A17872]|uniref:MarR family winged helix-turn-helix transcriptional regulator n=1 Tax=Celerinatantimonas sp. MCCC 1A17872 TaxID=3177514 RepID=UPI0038C4C151
MKSTPLESHVALLSQCIRESIFSALQDKGITLSFFQSLVLQRIAQDSPCTSHDVVIATKKDKAQITRLINELIKKELVIRKKNERDKRESILLLTEQGQHCAQLILQTRQEISEKMTHGISKELQQQLGELLITMQNNLS